VLTGNGSIPPDGLGFVGEVPEINPVVTVLPPLLPHQKTQRKQPFECPPDGANTQGEFFCQFLPCFVEPEFVFKLVLTVLAPELQLLIDQ
jgi:hypothetical protein